METVGNPILWAAFIGFVLVMLALDLGVFHRKAHALSLREAGAWSAVWVALSAVFALGVGAWFGEEHALEFVTGYLIEKALAVDNIFVFVILFSAFGVRAEQQHRVLAWGVLGALAMRAGFIFLGGAFLGHFHWAIYVFGGVLALTGVKLLVQRNAEDHPENGFAVRMLRKVLPLDPAPGATGFFTVVNGRRMVTTLFLALVSIEITDLIFAVDSIPAIFAVTDDPFIVFTSNIFAILGLRSMYFLLAGLIGKVRYLKVGLAFVLIFVGAKMLMKDVYHLPIGVALGGIVGILGASILASWWAVRREVAQPKPAS
ncbi:MAG: TerC family protein [Myxococcota bacterium]